MNLPRITHKTFSTAKRIDTAEPEAEEGNDDELICDRMGSPFLGTVFPAAAISQPLSPFLANQKPRDRYAERSVATSYLAPPRCIGLASENYHDLSLQDTIATLDPLSIQNDPAVSMLSGSALRQASLPWRGSSPSGPRTPELLGRFIHDNAPVEGAAPPIGSKVELRKTVLPPTSISTS